METEKNSLRKDRMSPWIYVLLGGCVIWLINGVLQLLNWFLVMETLR